MANVKIEKRRPFNDGQHDPKTSDKFFFETHMPKARDETFEAEGSCTVRIQSHSKVKITAS